MAGGCGTCRIGKGWDVTDRGVRMLKHRLQALAWWTELRRREPNGVITQALAAKFLGCTPDRVSQRVHRGDMRVYYFLDEAKPHNRLIPVDDLLLIGGPADSGAPGLYGFARMNSRKTGDNQIREVFLWGASHTPQKGRTKS